MTKEPVPESIREVLARLIQKCAASAGKCVLVLTAKEREDTFVPKEDGLLLHQDSLEFIDADGAHTVLPFASIALIEVDEDDEVYEENVVPKADAHTGEVIRFPRRSEN
ncbi:hypothetical protein ACRQ5Q_18880 [Bradyrhizobium sp. PMVTL-01]|uniref:hypothetical protein n=1 Tax=Bradyrhizobium sp. PMVTL-01 TaxID=3434999 RepID=UPI003F6E623E